jgi:hypothetical protein
MLTIFESVLIWLVVVWAVRLVLDYHNHPTLVHTIAFVVAKLFIDSVNAKVQN